MALPGPAEVHDRFIEKAILGWVTQARLVHDYFRPSSRVSRTPIWTRWWSSLLRRVQRARLVGGGYVACGPCRVAEKACRELNRKPHTLLSL